jgi:ubiquinone/menaquinone biosynthesis C-methylase UbiE
MISKVYNFISTQFSNPHGIFGSIITVFMNLLNKKQYQSILSNINIEKTSVVLDVGFGNGYLIRKILSKNPKKIYGIDISKDMVNQTKRKMEKHLKNKKIDLMVADVKDLPFNNDLFDSIYTVNTMYFWDYPKESFSEIIRTLKKDGMFLNVVYSKEWLSKSKITEKYNKYDINEIKEMTNKAGFNILNIIEIENKKSYCIISRKS